MHAVPRRRISIRDNAFDAVAAAAAAENEMLRGTVAPGNPISSSLSAGSGCLHYADTIVYLEGTLRI